ncbi:SDR family oxidoreductase [Aquimarina brevivitae]|uniref:3-oxoacyl-[acyl-carrier protein] reductase n=1 Tax=Aquimarina brevivitae TaxID=323412 RepID=A0A4Q7P254_9FLAO|nr:SDR family oxidoreductase [Aquimarina brevivitae]RZS93963.1 3-oxoacyl-[acyl-carrier protein] reductase [Aquimarina brevivitae]
MNLKEAKILITGGNSGIGKATAKLLKDKGAEVIIAGRNKETLEGTAKELELGYIQADVTQEEEVVRMVEQAASRMNGLNVLINNAGYGYVANLVDIEPQKLRDQLDTNIVGAALCARECAKIFVDQDYGNIINIGSTSSLKGSPTASPYVATKFALRGMTESWRNELRPHNIRVMQVNPSEVMTSFSDNRVDNNKKEKQYTAAEQETKLRGEEIAHTIASLLSMDDRGFITEATVFATNPKV